MTNDVNTGSKKSLITRRGVLRAFAATTIVAAPTYANAAGFLRGGGDIRRLRMYNGRTGENMDTIYWIEGKYIKDAIKEINYFMRDWRQDQTKSMDIRNFDIMTAAHNLMDVTEPYTLLSGYRSPKTNAMLRSRSRAVAKNSLHVKGQAADLRLKSRSVSQIFKAGVSCGAGGVGRYSSSNFVHMDCGQVRNWGR
ncbi:MAG: Tat pathway signal protein [Marinosulfonomonas sp.]|nr:MAG: Tat pathway signal protein [Marinosulfonomonas sp.]